MKIFIRIEKMRNVVKHLHLVGEEFREEVFDDIEHLHISSSKDGFDKANSFFSKNGKLKSKSNLLNTRKKCGFHLIRTDMRECGKYTFTK